MLRLNLSDDPVADVNGPLGLVHGFHELAAVGAQQVEAAIRVSRRDALL